MSGNTSETRCKHCGGEEGHLVHHAGKGFKNAHKFEPTPPEGEAVPEQVMCNWRQDGNPPFNCKLPANHSGDHSPVSSPIPAPVVSTAAPETPKSNLPANQMTANSGVAHGFPVAPESYKPAEEVMPTATEDDDRSHIRRSAKEASLKTPGLAATPVTVEAPERPEWFNYIRVRQRTNLSTKQTDFVASFGPRNILTPEADAETMERKLEMVKEWLWLFMNKKQ